VVAVSYALWQGDAFFVRGDSNLVASEAWA